MKTRIERIWAMPNKWTFGIKPIKELLDTEIINGLCVSSGGWVDPFSGKCGERYCVWTNDLDNSVPAKEHIDALEFLKSFDTNSRDGVLYDPPYSITQARQYGKKEYASMKYWAECKNEVARIIKPGGKQSASVGIVWGWERKEGLRWKGFCLCPTGAVEMIQFAQWKEKRRCEMTQEKMRGQRREQMFRVLTERHPEWKIVGKTYNECKEVNNGTKATKA